MFFYLLSINREAKESFMCPLENDKKYLLIALKKFRKELRIFLGGKEDISNTVTACLMAGGNLLLEDSPGVGKTTFVKLLAKYLDLTMKRVQCTSDLLPTDIIGVQVYDQANKKFSFHEGPIFSNILLADELNRTSPKTQSALLEAMEEKTITVDRFTKKLPNPFFVIATQNPIHYTGTFALPESQMDRFSARVNLNYPTIEKEKEIFSKALLNPLKAIENKILSSKEILKIQELTENIHVSEKITNCVQSVVNKSRNHEQIQLGISTRGGIHWVRLAKAIALLSGRDFVTPDDLIAVSKECLMHRILYRHEASEIVLQDLLKNMEI